MLDIRHEGRTVIVAWDGSLDAQAADAILAAVDLNAGSSVVIDLMHATTIGDSALLRLAQRGPLHVRGLRTHQSRLLRYLSDSHQGT